VTQTASGATPGGELLARAAAWYAALPPRRRELVQDTALALGLALLNVLSLLPYQSRLHPSWLAFLLVAGQCLPLALRRVWPVPALIGCGVLRDLYDVLQFGYAPLPLAPAIGFATVADRSGPALRWGTVVGLTAGVAWSQTLPGHNQPYDAIVQYFIFGAAWAIGVLSRHRRVALAAAASRAERAEASLTAAATRAAAAERLRIARELHDVVSHHVSLMAVQAEAVGALLPARPEAAATSADLIGSTARATMTELRRLLGVLRFREHEEYPERGRLAPVPSLTRLDELAEAIREAGLPVTCETTGAVAPLPPGVDLTAYRIIQEALTNALRHAPGASASVRVAYEPSHVTVEVTNTDPARAASPVAPSPVAPSPVAPSPVPVGAALARAAAGPLPSLAAVGPDPGSDPGPGPVPGSGPAPAPGARSAARGGLAHPGPARIGLTGPGYGLAGIAERVASCGGALSLGPAGAGGFTVTARLPLT
jgi:signal transduction histidine kinase